MWSRHNARTASIFVSLSMAMAATLMGVTQSPVGAATKKAPITVGSTYWDIPPVHLDQFVAATKAAVRAVNKKGGVDGHHINLMVCGENDPNQAEACARSFVSAGAVATLSDSAINDETAYDQILAQANIPQLDPFLTIPASFADPNVYLLSGEANMEYATTLNIAKTLKLKTYNLVVLATTGAIDVSHTVAQAAKYYGLKEVGTAIEVPLTAADFSPYVADAASANADVTILAIPPAQSALFVQAAAQLHAKLRIGIDAQFSLDQAKQYGQSGGAINGSLIADAIPPVSAVKRFPALKQYEKDMRAEFKSGDSVANLRTISPEADERWLTGKVFFEVAKQMMAKGIHTLTATKVKHYLNTVKDLSLLGLLPRWTPSAKGPAQFPRVSQPYLYLMTVKKGKIVLFKKNPVKATKAFKKA